MGDTECKWLGVSDVMKLLKGADEEGVNIRVVSMLDSSSQPMVTPFVSGFSLPSILRLVEELYLIIPLKKDNHLSSLCISAAHQECYIRRSAEDLLHDLPGT